MPVDNGMIKSNLFYISMLCVEATLVFVAQVFLGIRTCALFLIFVYFSLDSFHSVAVNYYIIIFRALIARNGSLQLGILTSIFMLTRDCYTLLRWQYPRWWTARHSLRRNTILTKARFLFMPTTLQMPEFPRKLYYKINEVATITRLKAHVLRYWETEFPLLNPEKDENDQRRYREKDIELILHIKRLLHEEGYTIKGARQQLKQRRQSAVSGSNVIDIEPLAETRSDRIARLDQLRARVRMLRREVSDLNAFLQA